MDIGRSIADGEVPDFEVGYVFYECESGMNLEAKVTSKPVEVEGLDGKRSWEWTAQNTQNGSSIDYKLTEGFSHYGPRLYTKPQYVHIGKDKDFVFKLLGADDA